MIYLNFLLMPMMYSNKRRNATIILFSVLLFGLSLFSLRGQFLVSDVQYMKAMIPHHSSAIITSKHAGISDPELRKLSEQIIKSQEEEIKQMKMIIERLESQK